VTAAPFGAEIVEGGVRFRLWAPAAKTVELCVEGAAPLAMARTDGWFELTTGAARAGTRYRYRIDGGIAVPDPASRYQPEDAHGPSAVVDPGAYRWQHAWTGRKWHETVLYELHVGAFSPEGTFDGVRRRLDHVAALGATAIELMPLSDFPGARGWGYDGVLPFAPDSAYGTPADLKRLIDTAHGRGLMMFLDVVYNHFGPDGNYLHLYAPQFFTERFHTPWGAAIDFSRREVRDFFIANALAWLEEYRFDGLRFDAVHAIRDESAPDILEELADTMRARLPDRHVHLVLENDDNAAHYLRRAPDGAPRRYVAQWNDDIHHAMHVLATGESGGYYADYADDPAAHLARCLAEGFAYQGEASPHRDGRRRGEASAHLPPGAFVSFLQNHDQIGNRAFGERITSQCESRAAAALAAIYLLAPSPPMIFMGEEWAAPEPFPFFCDFHDALADAVREGRRREFARFPAFRDPEARARIPDPNAEATFLSAVLDWAKPDHPPHAERLALYRELLAIRRREIVPRAAGIPGGAGRFARIGTTGIAVAWKLADGGRLVLCANPGAAPKSGFPALEGATTLYATDAATTEALARGELPPWSVVWSLVDEATTRD
jgi:malto-oligosyltrehalose trehalohydrolase